eukprot:PhF_6_TR22550/c1_g1_i2/m.32068
MGCAPRKETKYEPSRSSLPSSSHSSTTSNHDDKKKKKHHHHHKNDDMITKPPRRAVVTHMNLSPLHFNAQEKPGFDDIEVYCEKKTKEEVSPLSPNATMNQPLWGTETTFDGDAGEVFVEDDTSSPDPEYECLQLLISKVLEDGLRQLQNGVCRGEVYLCGVHSKDVVGPIADEYMEEKDLKRMRQWVDGIPAYTPLEVYNDWKDCPPLEFTKDNLFTNNEVRNTAMY